MGSRVFKKNSPFPACPAGRRNPQSAILLELYKRLYGAYGSMHWWPGDTPFEVMVGAILTQNTNWRNVEKAIQNLKEKGVLNPKGIHQLERKQLASLIKPSGYFRIKADRLKAFLNFLFKNYNGSIESMKKEKMETLRPKLLEVKGIGPETADSILLYGLREPVFVVDAYTNRILSRHGIVSERASYEEIQTFCMDHLPHKQNLFNEYHALLVHLGKTLCKRVPRCGICPLSGIEHSAKGKG